MQVPTGLGAVIALVTLVLAIVFLAVGRLDVVTGVLIGCLALSRLT